MTTATHRLHLDTRTADDGRTARAVCTCGWVSEWMPPADAVESGTQHAIAAQRTAS